MESISETRLNILASDRKNAATVSLASGSSGNSLLYIGRKTALLLDAGISCRKITDALSEIGLDPSFISAVLVTHEHSDHVAGLDVFARKFALPIYMSAGTYEGWSKRCPKAREHDVRIVEGGQSFEIDDLEIKAFNIPHDAEEAVSFRINEGKFSVSLLTDLGIFTDEVFNEIRGSGRIYIEANYDTAMLKAGPYPYPLKMRIAGKRGHLSNDESAEAIMKLIESGTEEFILSHLSVNNNIPALAELSVKSYLKDRQAVCGRDYILKVAPRFKIGEILCCGLK